MITDVIDSKFKSWTRLFVFHLTLMYESNHSPTSYG